MHQQCLISMCGLNISRLSWFVDKQPHSATGAAHFLKLHFNYYTFCSTVAFLSDTLGAGLETGFAPALLFLLLNFEWDIGFN
jgi:hypothetical protein